MKFDKLFLLREATKPKKINIDASQPEDEEETSEDYSQEMDDEETDYNEDAPEMPDEDEEETDSEEETGDAEEDNTEEEESVDYEEDAPEDEEGETDDDTDTGEDADATDDDSSGDGSTDYGDGAPDSDESNDDSYNNDDSDSSGDTEPADAKTQEENKRNLTLFTDMGELYTSIKAMMQKIEDSSIDDLIILKVLRQVRSNLAVLSEQIFNYLVRSFNSSNYITNLYNYNLFKEALSLNVEMITKINKIRNDKGKQSSKNIYK
jgi:hypothetical protein|nr:MAG TPA: hypothetical protein [Caudoviricetes sp.]